MPSMHSLPICLSQACVSQAWFVENDSAKLFLSHYSPPF